MKRTLVLSSLTAATLFAAVGHAQVVISQVYGGGGNGSATYKNDFVELFNKGTTPVNLSGWSIQYHSSVTTTLAWSVTNLGSFVLQPGQYYLIQEFSAAAIGADLPTPDASGVINMNQNNGHIALVSSTTALQTAPPQAPGPGVPANWHTLPGVLDYVGYGAANDWEGAGTAPAISSTLSATRNCNGCGASDLESNAGDFTAVTPSAHNTSFSPVPCGTASPDLALTLTNSGCNPALNGAYQMVATVSNGGCNPSAAHNATISVVLPVNLTYANSSASAGTTSYTPGNRTVTATLGTLGIGGTATLTVNTTLNAIGGISVGASTATSDAEVSLGNNSIAYDAPASQNVAVDPANPLHAVAVSGPVGSPVSTIVFEDISGIPFERHLTFIGRPFRSPDGTKFIVQCNDDEASADNGMLIVGSISGATVTYSIVAHDGFTKPSAANPTWKILPESFNKLQSINNAGQYVYTCQLTDGGGTPVITNALVKGTVGVAGNTCILQGDAVPAASGITGTFTNLQSASIQTDGTVSFLGTFTGTTATNAAFFRNDGATVLARKGVFVPTGQAGGGTAVMNLLESDATQDGRGVRLSENGTNWIATGTIDTGNTATDNVIVLNGAVVCQEGSVLAGSTFTDAAGWNTFGTQGIPWVNMDSDGSSFIQGYNPATGGFNQGQDWVMRSGSVIAKTGAPIVPASTETWADNILQRTFFMSIGNGGDYVVGGLSNRSTSGPDIQTDGVLVLNGSVVVLRENQPVDIGPSGGPADIRYVNRIFDNEGCIGTDRNLYVSCSLRSTANICTNSFTGLAAVLLKVPLPSTVCSPADIGVQGGTFGHDNLLDNNDFVVFIELFFNNDPYADLGVQGGIAGHDGNFDNNDFIVFIEIFFTGQPFCTGNP